jgi:hypothetical protein
VSTLILYQIYLWSKLLCFVCHAKIFQTTMLHAMLLVSFGSSQWVGVRQLGLKLFGVTMWKLLIIEPFFQWKLNKIKTEYYIRIWKRSWCHLESPWWITCNRVYFIIFRAKVWKILIFEWILLLDIQINCKNWVWKEKLVESSMCSHLGQ